NPQKRSLWYQPPSSPVWETYTYDGIGRLTKTTHPNGTFATTTYSMDASGKPYNTATDESGHVRSSWYDAFENVTHVREKKDASSSYDTYYTYDAAKQLVQVWDASNHVATTNTYSSRGFRLSITDQDLGTWTYTYDAAGRVLTATD